MDNVNTYKVNKEAVKKIAEKVYDNGSTVINRNDLEELFPELQESGDERIRKAIGYAIGQSTHSDGTLINGVSSEEALAWLEKQGEQKPIFEMKTPEESLGVDSDTYNKIVDECIYGEQNTAWSEEDEKMLGKCIDAASGYYSPEDKQSMKDWLKSLKERYTWKPSDKQMKAIGHICDGNYNVDLDILDSIYRDFKKLREE